MFKFDVLEHWAFRTIFFETSWTIVLPLNLISISSVPLFPLRCLSSNIIFKLFFCFFLFYKKFYFVKNNLLVDLVSFLVEFLDFFLKLFTVGFNVENLFETLVIEFFWNNRIYTWRLNFRIEENIWRKIWVLWWLIDMFFHGWF